MSELFKPLPEKRMTVIADGRTFEILFTGHVEELMDSQGDEWDEVTIFTNVYENGVQVGIPDWNDGDYADASASAMQTIIDKLSWDDELDEEDAQS